MADMFHFPKISIAKSGIRAEIDLQKYGRRGGEAQAWLGDRVLESSRAYMPMLTGDMQQRSHTEAKGRRVVFPGPYARVQYMGKVMVDSETGRGPRKVPTGTGEYVLRFRAGAKLKASDRDISYSRPEAKAKWFEYAKSVDLKAWLQGVKKTLLGGK